MRLSPAYPVQTERLLLRPLDPTGDVEAVHAYLSLPQVCRYIPMEPHTREEVVRRLARPIFARTELTEPEQGMFLGIVEGDTGRLVGDVMINWFDATNVEIGYVVNPDVQGRGYATEAASAVLGLVFEGLGLHRVTAKVDRRNPASAAVLTKLGMRREAVLVESEWFKGEWSTEEVYAILDREWRAGGARGR